jgi:hypothetical protein
MRWIPCLMRVILQLLNGLEMSDIFFFAVFEVLVVQNSNPKQHHGPIEPDLPD